MRLEWLEMDVKEEKRHIANLPREDERPGSGLDNRICKFMSIIFEKKAKPDDNFMLLAGQ